MSSRESKLRVSRRTVLSTVAGGAASLAMAPRTGQAAAPAGAARPRPTVRDHLWIFTVPAGADDNWYELGGVRGGSRMTPAEGAFYLNIPNLILVRNDERPPLPSLEGWRAKTAFEQYALSFRPLDRVLWSVVGSGGRGGMRELGPVLQLAAKYPNLSGIYLDDFIVDARPRDGKKPVPLDLMKHQCDRALAWIREKRIHEVIVLGNTGLDLGLPSAEYVRDWIAQVGSQPVPV